MTDEELLSLIGISDPNEYFYRYREVFEMDGHVVVCCRMGGGNRECWEWDKETDPDTCACPGCGQKRLLPTHPQYLYDYDGEGDSTYNYIHYKVNDDKAREAGEEEAQ